LVPVVQVQVHQFLEIVEHHHFLDHQSQQLGVAKEVAQNLGIHQDHQEVLVVVVVVVVVVHNLEELLLLVKVILVLRVVVVVLQHILVVVVEVLAQPVLDLLEEMEFRFPQHLEIQLLPQVIHQIHLPHKEVVV
jgi:hypothetical protein